MTTKIFDIHFPFHSRIKINNSTHFQFNHVKSWTDQTLIRLHFKPSHLQHFVLHALCYASITQTINVRFWWLIISQSINHSSLLSLTEDILGTLLNSIPKFLRRHNFLPASASNLLNFY